MSYWTKDRCAKEALKYKTRSDFRNNSGSAYSTSVKNKWLNDICNHMIALKKVKGYWTFEKCREEALKYSYRNCFEKNSKVAYYTSIKRGWHDELCSHMEEKGNLYKRMIYAYEFDDNHVYIGLTCDLKRRQRQHENSVKSSVYNHIINNNANYKLIKLTGFLNIKEAKINEQLWLDKYIKQGWMPLNKVKTGGVGGAELIWTYEKCKETALRYKYKKDLWENNVGCYNAAKNKHWLEDICSHMVTPIKQSKYNIEKVLEESLKYSTRSDFKKQSPLLYNAAVKNGWLIAACKHMSKPRSKDYMWTFEKCKEFCDKNKCKNRKEFSQKHVHPYKIIIKNGWGELLPSLLVRPKWTYEECKERAKIYENKHKFKINESGDYQAALKNKWIDDFFK